MFNPKNALLASDLKFQEESASFWLRSPKVNRESFGDVVEVWSVSERTDLDRITVLKAYVKKRYGVFGDEKSYPLFSA